MRDEERIEVRNNGIVLDLIKMKLIKLQKICEYKSISELQTR
jgi:hypothetical protein